MLRALKRVKPSVLILLSLIFWLYGGGRISAENYTAYARRTPRIADREIRFDALLSQLRDVVGRKEFQNISKLVELKRGFVEENEKVQKHFKQIETLLKEKKVDGEILNRQAEFARQYEAKYEALMAHLNAIESAHNNESVDRDGVLTRALHFLEENTSRERASYLDPKNLPHRSLKAGKPIAPKLTRDEWLKAFASQPASAKTQRPQIFAATAPPAPADLTETDEVRFTSEIRQLADSLERNPVKIFNWVRNNIEFVPTWGSIQGAQLCLENRAGNGFDTASLLIALLRYSGIPARYQMGTIEVPIDRFMNWAGGFTNAEAAASLFASAGVPSVVRRVNHSGQVATVRLEHVWVKGFVDYAPSGGASHIQGDTWVDFDPSFKQYDFPAPVDLSQFVRVGNAQTFLNQALAPATVNQTTGEIANMDLALIQSRLQPDEDAVFNYLSTNFPQRSVREIIGAKSIAVRQTAILAARLPYKVLALGTSFTEVPVDLRHGFEITIVDAAGVQQLSFARSLPAISGSRIVLGYVPASEADRQALAALIPADPQQPTPSVIPTTFVNMRPELRIDDQVVGAGNALRMGTTQSLHLRFTSPTIATPEVVNTITAGEVFAIALDLQQVSASTLDSIAARFQQIANEVQAHPENPSISPREIEHLLLNSIAFGWFSQVDLLNRITAQMFGVVSARYPSAAITFSDLAPVTLFGAVYQVALRGFTMDIDRDVVVTLSKSGDQAAVAHHGVVMGMLGSGLEASAPGQVFHTAGQTDQFWLATSSALALAQSLGDTTVALNSTNFPLVSSRLGMTSGDLQDVQDALNAGLTVMTHERQLRDRGGSSFLGYIEIDMQTGSGAYIIGGANGSQALRCFEGAVGLPSTIVVDGWIDIGQSVISDTIDDWGGPGRLATSVISLITFLNNLDENVKRYERALPELQETARPLLGLILMMAGLNVLKEIVQGGFLVGAYLNMVSWTAFRMAELLINRIIMLDAVEARGVQVAPGCIS